MATQTKTQRQTAAKKAAATRKRNAAKQSGGTTKASARRTAKRAQAEATRLEAVARQAERAVLIPVGAALEARDRVTETAHKYTDRELARKEFNRFERRGAGALKRNRRSFERQAKVIREDVGERANGVGSSVGQVVERVRSLA